MSELLYCMLNLNGIYTVSRVVVWEGRRRKQVSKLLLSFNNSINQIQKTRGHNIKDEWMDQNSGRTQDL